MNQQQSLQQQLLLNQVKQVNPPRLDLASASAADAQVHASGQTTNQDQMAVEQELHQIQSANHRRSNQNLIQQLINNSSARAHSNIDNQSDQPQNAVLVEQQQPQQQHAADEYSKADQAQTEPENCAPDSLATGMAEAQKNTQLAGPIHLGEHQQENASAVEQDVKQPDQ